jgi:hypothetical protein
MRKLSLVVLVGLASIPALAAAQEGDAAGEAAMLVRMNVLREDAGLTLLVRSAELDLAARAHSSDMAQRNVIEHVSPVSGTPADRVERAGVSATTVAENVAMHRDTAHALEALLASDGHRANIMAPDVTHVGLASVQTPSGVYVTQVFARIEAQPEPEPAVVAEAPAPQAEEPVSIFQIIPPFVEQLLGAGAAAQAADAQATVDGQAADAETLEIPAVVPTPVFEAPQAAEAPGAIEAPAPGSAVPVPAPQMTRETEAALRQMIGLAQSLLGGAVTVE